MKYCQWCDESFESNVSYQIYCSPECRTAATKQKIVERYQTNKRNNRKPRKCKSCKTILSIYNDDLLCQNCVVNQTEVAKALKELKGIANGKNWTDKETE